VPTIAQGIAKTYETQHPYYAKLASDNNSGLVLFSSGTTGTPKAIVLNLNKLIDRFNHVYHPRCTLGFMKLDHIGGINTLLQTLHKGGTLIVVEDRTPKAVLDLIDRHFVETLPVTPTFLTMALISGELQRHSLKSLQLITYGTEPMPTAILKRACSMLPYVDFKQTYGLSELGIIPSKSKDTISTWIKLSSKGFDYSVRDNILWIRADTAMLGYLNAPSPFDEEGFLNTNDYVITDGEYIKILGRSNEIINVAGEKVFPAEIENEILNVPEVAAVSVRGVPSPITGHTIVADVQLANSVNANANTEIEKILRKHCKARLAPFQVPALFKFREIGHTDRFKKKRQV
jgi:acyl-CoA synthetase (AMP-forming)/AMP-acid ligase II